MRLLEKNQTGHILQWLIYIAVFELLLFLVPVRAWIILVVIGAGFIIAAALRIAHLYPGEKEPVVVDIFSGILAFICAILTVIIENLPAHYVVKAVSPFIILIPHLTYIIFNRDIKSPALITRIRKVLRK